MKVLELCNHLPRLAPTVHPYALNRLDQTSMANHYSQTYTIDRYGNMVCTTGSNYCNSSLTFSATTNRITTSGYSYDAAGNLTADGTGYGTHTFQWDAEGRMVSVDGQAGQACQSSWTDCFTYNALGQRVQKHVGSPASDTYYYYDAFGNLAMTKGASQVNEYLFPGNFGKYYWTGSAWETDYTHKNLVGSTQVVTRADGSYAQAQNFYSFGGVRWHSGGTQDVRYASMQERDAETQTWQDPLDPTWFRTYTSGLGRWFSPDPLAGDITNPQSLNRYAYALNNPTTLTDPLGRDPSHPPSCTTMDCAWQYYGGTMPAFLGGNLGVSCEQDGAPANCAFALMSLVNGSVAQCPDNVCEGVNGNGQWAEYHAFAGMAGAVSGYYAAWGVGSLAYSLDQAGISASNWGTWYLEQTHREAGGSLWCGYGVCSSTLQEPGAADEGGVFLDRTFADVPAGTSGAGWWRATNGESPMSDLRIVDAANSQAGTSFPQFTGTTSGGGRVLLYDPANQGPFECVLVGGLWWYGNEGQCQ